MAVETKPKGNPPVARVQVGSVQGAVWRQTSREGKTFYSATFTNRYKDGETWKDGDSYSHLDLLALQEATRQAYADIEALKAKDKAAGTQHEREPGAEG